MEPCPGVRVARVYEPPRPEDGARVLVDRLWPRGLAKDAAALAALCRLRRKKPLTLLTATKALDVSHATILADVLCTRPQN